MSMTAFPADARYVGVMDPSRPCDRCGKVFTGKGHGYEYDRSEFSFRELFGAAVTDLAIADSHGLEVARLLLVCPECHREYRARVRVHKHGKERRR